MKFKEFFSEAKRDIWKLFTTHLVMMIFGIMVYIPIGIDTANRRLITLILSILTIVFYYYLIDLHMWDVGAKDAIRVRAGTLGARPLAGFYTGLAAAVPDMILGILFVIFYLSRSYGPVLELCNYIFSLLTRTWEGMFVGLEMSVFGKTAAVIADGVAQINVTVDFWPFYLITPFISAAFAGISYYCGTKEFTIIPRPKNSSK